MSFFTHHANATHTISVYAGSAFKVIFGANEGDTLGIADDLVAGDVYALQKTAKIAALALQIGAQGELSVARTSHAGTPGNTIHLDCVLTLMSNDAAVIEALVLVETDLAGRVVSSFLLPLAAIVAQEPCHLIGIDNDAAAPRFAQVACPAFTRGTRITLGNGLQKRVEALAVGDVVLTRNNGVQTVRWIGHTTQRATGDFAPVRIAAGALNNDRDLVVSPDHRIFIHQRSDQIGAGRAELLIKARHLLNGSTVTCDEGGFVDYYQVLFDQHQIVFAEGIAAESLPLDARTSAVLPKAVAQVYALAESAADAPALSGFDLPASFLRHTDATKLLREASAG